VRAALRVLSAGVLAVSLAAQGEQGDADARQVAAAVDALVEQAVAEFRDGDAEASRRSMQRALQAAELDDAAEDCPDALVNALWLLGRAAYRTGAFDIADEALLVVLRDRERELPEGDRGVQVVRHQLALVRMASGDALGARRLFERILAVPFDVLPEQHPSRQVVRGALAETLVSLGELEAGLEMKEQVLAAFAAQFPEDHENVLMARASISETLTEMGDYARALALQKQVFDVHVARLPDDHPELQRDRSGLARIYALLGDVERAAELQEQVERVYAANLPENDRMLQRARMDLASSLEQLGELDRALAMHRDVLRVLSATLPDDHPDVQHARGSLATTLMTVGDAQGALALDRKMYEVVSRTMPADHAIVQAARTNLAATMHAAGDTIGAMELQRQAMRMLQEQFPEDHPQVRVARSNLAMMLMRHHDLAGAIELMRQVVAAAERSLSPRSPDRLIGLANLAGMLLQAGELAEARAMTDRCVAEFADVLTAEHPILLAVRQTQGVALRQLGEHEAARELLEDLLRVQRKNLSDEHESVQKIRTALALTLLDLGDAPGAARQLLAAGRGALQRLRLQSLSTRAGAEVTLRAASLLNSISRALAPSVAMPAAEADELREVGLRLLVCCQHHELHARQLRRTVALDDPATYDRLVARLRAAVARIEEAIATPVDASEGEAAASSRDEAITTASLARDRIEEQLTQLVPVAERAVPGGAALAARLAPGEAAIAFDLYYPDFERDPEGAGRPAGRYGAYVLLPAGRIRWVDLAADRDVGECIERLRALATGAAPDPGERASDELFAKLDRALFDPLRAVLPEGVERLVLSLAFDLHLVPFEALPAASQYDLRVVWSLRALLDERGDAPVDPQALVVGGVAYELGDGEPIAAASGAGDEPVQRGGGGSGGGDGEVGDRKPVDFAPLSAAEAQAVARTYRRAFPQANATLLSGAAASEAAFVERAPAANYLHVATHGYFAPEQSVSAEQAAAEPLTQFSVAGSVARLSPYSLTGLALAGANRQADELGRREGILTAQEVADLDLSTCHLVTLSACETSLGVRNGTGLASLRSAFHAAGARFVLSSLWKVSDQQAERVMRDFYTRLWQHGDSPHDALRAAQQAARERRAPLREWAGWVLTGR